jgi:4-azaleucine resistance transporter AzlC
MPARRWQRAYSIFALTDESYSVLTALPAAERAHRMALVCGLNQGWWVLGTVLGVALGAQAQIGITGLDFVLAALFAVLAVEQWRARRDALPLWIAIASYGIALLVMPAQALAIAIGLSLLATLLRPARAAGAAHE